MFSASELAAMKQTQEAHMPDRCLVYFISKKQVDEWGNPIKEKSDPVKTCCGLEMNLHNGNSQSYVLELIEADAVIRLPGNIEVHPNDEIEVTHCFGEVEQVFDIVVGQVETEILLVEGLRPGLQIGRAHV